MFSILTYGLSVAVVGMATVFCGLIILIGFIKGMEKVLKSYIDAGKLGMAAGEGFYKYPKD